MDKKKRGNDNVEKRLAARARFKNLVRSVLLNLSWITEPEDVQEISLNVKKNVAMLTRLKPKFGLLSMAQKALIRTPVWCRTVEDRKTLCTTIAKLACFSRYPPKLRARLVPYIKFLIINPDIVLMKEGDFPITLYFILTGEVQMSRKKKSEALFGPGDCIGDVDLLENDFRTHTYTTVTKCELLVLYDFDYFKTLQQFMTKTWNEKKAALKSLSYFHFFNEDQILTACKFGHIKQYKPLDMIHSDDDESMDSSFTHYVLSGECVLLQALHMVVNQKGNRKEYELTVIEEDEKEKNQSIMLQKARKIGASVVSESAGKSMAVVESFFQPSSKDVELMKKKRQEGFRNIERLCGLNSSSDISNDLPENRPLKYRYEGDESDETISDQDESYNPKTRVDQASMYSMSTPFTSLADKESNESEILTASTKSSHQSFNWGIINRQSTTFETRFIDVGSFTYGAIFGLGEQLKHRMIISRTTVQCLLLPRFWLFENEQNPGNIWERHRFFLDFNIPTREKLFKQFLETSKWGSFKNEYIQSILKPTTQLAKPEDIPILCHLMEPPK